MGMTVDFTFKISGKEIPVDHGYALYAAISQIVPQIKTTNEFGIHSINGKIFPKENKMQIKENSNLTIRTDINNLPIIYALSNREINVLNNTIQIQGISSIKHLEPYENLYSKMVTINGVLNKEDFVMSMCKNIEKLSLSTGQFYFQDRHTKKPTFHIDDAALKTMSIHGKNIIGFPLYIFNLSQADSLLLQTKGLGGKRTMGKGILIHAKNIVS